MCLWIPLEILTWLTAKSLSIMTSSSSGTCLRVCFIPLNVCMFVACRTLVWYHVHCCVWIKLHALCLHNQTHGWGRLRQRYRQALAAFVFPVLVWPQRLGHMVAFKKGGSSLLPHNIFLSLSFGFMSPCFFFSFNHNFSLGNCLEREKVFWSGKERESEEMGCGDSKRGNSMDAVNILFPDLNTTFLDVWELEMLKFKKEKAIGSFIYLLIYISIYLSI